MQSPSIHISVAIFTLMGYGFSFYQVTAAYPQVRLAGLTLGPLENNQTFTNIE